ncbi:MAG: hypothetical protein AB8G05_11810 [Oligoflexales bacterium]
MSKKEYIVNSVVEFEEYAKSGVEIIKIKQSVLSSVEFGFDDIASKYGYERVNSITPPTPPIPKVQDDTDPSEASESSEPLAETVEDSLVTFKRL